MDGSEVTVIPEGTDIYLHTYKGDISNQQLDGHPETSLVPPDIGLSPDKVIREDHGNDNAGRSILPPHTNVQEGGYLTTAQVTKSNKNDNYQILAKEPSHQVELEKDVISHGDGIPPDSNIGKDGYLTSRDVSRSDKLNNYQILGKDKVCEKSEPDEEDNVAFRQYVPWEKHLATRKADDKDPYCNINKDQTSPEASTGDRVTEYEELPEEVPYDYLSYDQVTAGAQKDLTCRKVIAVWAVILGVVVVAAIAGVLVYIFVFEHRDDVTPPTATLVTTESPVRDVCQTPPTPVNGAVACIGPIYGVLGCHIFCNPGWDIPQSATLPPLNVWTCMNNAWNQKETVDCTEVKDPLVNGNFNNTDFYLPANCTSDEAVRHMREIAKKTAANDLDISCSFLIDCRNAAITCGPSQE